MSFFKSKATTVPELLAEGNSWVERLEAASVVAEDDAIVLEAQANLIQCQADVTRITAEEGRAVAANFRKMLKPNS